MEVQIREKIYNCMLTYKFSGKYYSDENHKPEVYCEVLWSVQIINHKR